MGVEDSPIDPNHMLPPEVPTDEQPIHYEEHGEVPGHIEVASPQEQGVEHQSPSDIEHVEVPADPITDGLVDEAKAWDMAHAGKTERDAAAEKRTLADEERQLLSEIDVLRAKLAEGHDDDGLRAEREAIEKRIFRRNDGGYNYERILMNDESPDTTSSPHRTPRQKIEEKAKELEREGEKHDAKATEMENWASILHDHPISERFQQAHERVAFKPRILQIIESNAKRSLDNAAEEEEYLERQPITVGVTGFASFGDTYPRFPGDVMEAAYGCGPSWYGEHKADEDIDKYVDAEGREKLQQYLDLIDNPDATLGQLRDLYVEAFKKAYIDPERENAKNDLAMLDDIRSGRASQ